MCGIVGLITEKKVEHELIYKMIESIKHRGPDDTGSYINKNIGLGYSRLSIIDPENGKQPVANEDESIVVVFNGEIFNYLELREELRCGSHTIKNNSDTAILPHMYEQYGLEMFEKLNGQFAIAIWDEKNRKLVLARDRMGEKPLYYFYNGQSLCFASEVKAILKSGIVKPEISPDALSQVFTYWSTLSDRSVFQDVYSIPPACFLVFQDRSKTIMPYWEFRYNEVRNENKHDINYYINELDLRLRKSIKRCMLADVPLLFYMSGGLDSSIISAIAADISSERLNTFSITFDDVFFDESEYQKLMSNYLGTNHQELRFTMKELPSIIKEVIYYTETPVLRTGVFPMYALAKLVNMNNKKVVLSGEGADELFGGYDIFREVKIREFCKRDPSSRFRAALYKRVNNYIRDLDSQPVNSLSMFYDRSDMQWLTSSHTSRWILWKYSKQFFSKEFQSRMNEYDYEKSIMDLLPEKFDRLTPIQRAQYLEIMIFLPNYLLSSQGDRVSMASGVECRYPFLDNEVLDFAAILPDNFKIKALNEKYIVKKLAQKYLPQEIINRKKYPYRAPINIPELMQDEYIEYILGYSKLKDFGVFNPDAVKKYLLSLLNKRNINEKDIMLFLGILTTQILIEHYVA